MKKFIKFFDVMPSLLKIFFFLMIVLLFILLAATQNKIFGQKSVVHLKERQKNTTWEWYFKGWGNRAKQKFALQNEPLLSYTRSNASMNVKMSDIPLVPSTLSLEKFSFMVDIPLIGNQKITFDGFKFNFDKEFVLQKTKDDFRVNSGVSVPFGFVRWSYFKGALAPENPIISHFKDGKWIDPLHIAQTGSKLLTQSKDDAWQLYAGLRASDILLGMREPVVYFGKQSQWYIRGELSYYWLISFERSYRFDLEAAGLDLKAPVRKYLQDYSVQGISLPVDIITLATDAAGDFINQNIRKRAYIFGDPLLFGRGYSAELEFGYKDIGIQYRFSHQSARNFLTGKALELIGVDPSLAGPGPLLVSNLHEIGVVFKFGSYAKRKKQNQPKEIPQKRIDVVRLPCPSDTVYITSKDSIMMFKQTFTEKSESAHTKTTYWRIQLGAFQQRIDLNEIGFNEDLKLIGETTINEKGQKLFAVYVDKVFLSEEAANEYGLNEKLVSYIIIKKITTH